MPYSIKTQWLVVPHRRSSAADPPTGVREQRVRTGLPDGLCEFAQLGRSLWARHREILAYFDTGASNGPVGAIKAVLSICAGTNWGSNLNHYTLRSLIHFGQPAERLHAL